MSKKLAAVQPEGPLNGCVYEDGGLFNGGHYMAWTPGDEDITLDCRFSADELEAIVAHMRAHSPAR